MFADVKLDDDAVRVVKELRTAFNQACKAFIQLRKMAEGNPNLIIQANVTQLDITRAQTGELKKHVDWLYRSLKQKEAVKED